MTGPALRFPLDPGHLRLDRSEQVRRAYAKARRRARFEREWRARHERERLLLDLPVERGSLGLWQHPPVRPYTGPRDVAETLRRYLATPYRLHFTGTRAEFIQRLIRQTRANAMTYTATEANAILGRARYLQTHPSARKPITQAHRDEVVRNLQHGAVSYRALCVMLDRSSGRELRVDRGLVKRTLHSAVDRGEVIAVLVRRPGLTPMHRERKPFYVYAPAPHLLLERTSLLRKQGHPQVIHARRGVLG